MSRVALGQRSRQPRVPGTTDPGHGTAGSAELAAQVDRGCRRIFENFSSVDFLKRLPVIGRSARARVCVQVCLFPAESSIGFPVVVNSSFILFIHFI